ncbi:hypothetical protein ACLB2K_030815 [Fragaria x ananassa]
MNGFVINNQVSDAERIFTKYFKAGQCEHTVVSFTILIKGLCNVGNNSVAVCLLRKMHKNGFALNTVSYDSVIDGLCKSAEVKHHLFHIEVAIHHNRETIRIIKINSDESHFLKARDDSGIFFQFDKPSQDLIERDKKRQWTRVKQKVERLQGILNITRIGSSMVSMGGLSNCWQVG